MKPEIKFKWVPAQDGLRWVRHGLKAYVTQPFSYSLLMLVWLLLLLITTVPVVGVVAVVSMPLFSLGCMLATHQVLQGKTPRPSVFLLPLRVTRERTRALMALGGLYALGLMLLMVLCHWADGGAFSALSEAMMSDAATPADVAARSAALNARLNDPVLQTWLWARVAGLILLSAVFWFAPALVHWGGHGAGKALFFSVLACWRNKGALMLYALTWLALGMVVSLLSTLVAALLGPVAPMLAVPLLLSYMGAFYASLFFTFIDSFALVNSTPTVAPTAPPEEPLA